MSSTFRQLYYHFVWAPKNRAPIITPQIETILKNFFPEKIKTLAGTQLALNMVNDHLHLAATVPPRTSVSEFMNIIKGSSSHHVNVTLGEKTFYWQTGFGALTISKNAVPFIVSYIENQKQRHRENNIDEELEHIPDEDEWPHGEQSPTERLAGRLAVQRPS